MARKLFDKAEMHNIFHLNSSQQVIDLITKLHADRATMDHVCVN